MEGCSKASAGAASGLPDDPLVEILSRVPAKSVCRFKCVSKAWRDLIADPGNRKRLRQAMQGLFVQSSEASEVNHTTKLARRSFSFMDLIVRSVPLDIYPSFPFLTEMIGVETFLEDSCNGLVLFGHRQEWSGPLHYTVCNPTTKQWSAVPACWSGEPVTNAYVAFTLDVSSHFHLVQFQMPNWYDKVEALHVYSSETGTWSQNQIDKQEELDSWHHQFTLDIYTANHLSAFVNGFLHVVVTRLPLGLQHILVLDVQGKATRMIDVPSMSDGRPGPAYVCYLGQSQGQLHCVTQVFAECEQSNLSIWVLHDYDTQEWVLKSTVDLSSFNVFGETGSLSEFHVVDIHQDCNVVLFLQDSCKLTAYDMDRKEVSVTATFEDGKDPWDFARYVPHFSESSDLSNRY